MKRLLLAAQIAFAAIAIATPATAQELPISLKASAILDSDVVKLNDLWDNLGPRGETILANAPVPGKRITADARWLANVAQTYGIKWQPASAFDRIVIERASQTIDMKLVETEIREALSMEGVPGNFEFEITNRSSVNLVIPAQGGETGIAVRDVQWDNRTARFSATLEIPAGSPTATRQRVNGRVFPVTKIPVLTHTMSRGDTISEKDLEWVTVREDDTRRDLVLDTRKLVGMEPRFQVRAGVPLRQSDLQRPMLVQRNSLVTISLRTPYMTLTAQGRASEDGGKGDVIHVVNLQSKRTFEAVVDGPGTVLVSSMGPRTLTN